MEDLPPTALTIAGSDPSGGAGLQADLKTFSHFGVFGMTAVTALTAGNTTGVKDVLMVDVDFISQQINAVCDDIAPRVIKLGLLANAPIIEQVTAELKDIDVPVVIDPVMATKRGGVLLSEDGVEAYKSHLLPQGEIVTPNIPEAELLSEMEIVSPDDMRKTAAKIQALGCESVIIKGGHFDDWSRSNDLFYDGDEFSWLHSKRIQTVDTHGAGDAFSAGITALLAKGKNRKKAVKGAKTFITKAIKQSNSLGSGEGPVSYNFNS